MSGEIFINYRGEDAGIYAVLLYMETARRFGAESVFLDSATIAAGSDFVEQLLSRVRRSPILLSVIGPRWLTVADGGGRPRIEDSEDWIRRELAEAFAAGATVIPVLTDGAAMPVETELPADIAALGRRQYRRLRYREATMDLARICADLVAADPALAAPPRYPSLEPGQLTADEWAFTGHTAELTALDRSLAGKQLLEPGTRPTIAVIYAITGTAGAGETASVASCRDLFVAVAEVGSEIAAETDDVDRTLRRWQERTVRWLRVAMRCCGGG